MVAYLSNFLAAGKKPVMKSRELNIPSLIYAIEQIPPALNGRILLFK
jgi:hypothetical protein